MREGKPTYGVGVHDAKGRKNDRDYVAWACMLRRCHSVVFRPENFCYRDCTVHPDWLVFSNFKAWYDKNYIEGYHLDKDLLVPGNTVYGPDTCVYVPPRINHIIRFGKNYSGNGIVGVRKNPNLKSIHLAYFAEWSDIDGNRQSKSFASEAEAYAEYRKQRANVIGQVAMTQREPIRSALLNWADLVRTGEFTKYLKVKKAA